MKCFYHTDADGICSGFWVNYYLKRMNFPEKMKFYPITYGMTFPLDEIEPKETVYIVDYSIEPVEMASLLDITDKVVWIDHHKSAIEKYEDFSREVKGIRRSGIAACLLTWAWFVGCKQGEQPFDELIEDMIHSQAPYFTRLVADYDIWKFDYGTNATYFHLAFDAKGYKPEDPEMIKLFSSYDVQEMIEQGKAINAYLERSNEIYCQNYGYSTEFEGYKAYVLNKAMCGTDTFRSVNDGSYELFISCAYDGEGWNYSLRSAGEADVSVIAAKYGGGGHWGAAGFRSKNLLV